MHLHKIYSHKLKKIIVGGGDLTTFQIVRTTTGARVILRSSLAMKCNLNKKILHLEANHS